MKKIGLLCLYLGISMASHAVEDWGGAKIKITSDVMSVMLKHKGKVVELQRNQDSTHEIDEYYKTTGNGTIQPMHPFAPHAVETIGELAMIDYLKQVAAGDDRVLVVDSRTPDWVARGTLPGAINVPYTVFSDPDDTADVLEDQFGVFIGDQWRFSQAKTLVMFCNGNWCGQSPASIRILLKLGYPAANIKYYRGGMQSWHSLGLTVVKP